MEGDERIEKHMYPVAQAIKRAMNGGFSNDVYNRAYEAAQNILYEKCAEADRLKARIAELEAKLRVQDQRVEAAGNLLESISVWFWKKTGMPDPAWVDQYEAVCKLFEPGGEDELQGK